jgi:hypothetical protein
MYVDLLGMFLGGALFGIAIFIWQEERNGMGRGRA